MIDPALHAAADALPTSTALTIAVSIVGALVAALLAVVLGWLRRLDQRISTVLDTLRDYATFRGTAEAHYDYMRAAGIEIKTDLQRAHSERETLHRRVVALEERLTSCNRSST